MKPAASLAAQQDVAERAEPPLNYRALNYRALNYRVVAQSAEEVRDTGNAPAVSMGPYLLASGQIELLTKISIYSQRGESREQVRLLYMNAEALLIWNAMGKRPCVIDAQQRPPRTALLTFGVPFSE
jgi:hypothetical protein